MRSDSILNGASLETEDHFMNSSANDDRSDAVLPDDIQVKDNARPHHFPPSQVLLTGASGFFGSFILTELLRSSGAQVHCLVRANSELEGHNRLKAALERYGLWKPEFSGRIVVHTGDLSAVHLGMDGSRWSSLVRDLDAIYHNGAKVTFVQSYAKLKAANVGGTLEVLRLSAEAGGCPVHYISSRGIYSGLDYPDDCLICEDDTVPPPPPNAIGYQRSKWVADTLVIAARARGIPTTVYRPTRLTGDSVSGVGNDRDFLVLLFMGCVELGSLPDLDQEYNLVPADISASEIVRLSFNPKSLGCCFNLGASEVITLKEMLPLLENQGFRLTLLPYLEWRRELLDALALGRVCPLAFLAKVVYEDVEKNIPEKLFQSDNLHRLLPERKVLQLRTQLERLFDWLRRSGKWPPTDYNQSV